MSSRACSTSSTCKATVIGRKDGSNAVTKEVGSPEELADVVGKDVAEKLLAAPKNAYGMREISGLDLKVGGEGMNVFYDTLIPQVANDLLKKLGGGRVETVEIDTRTPESDAWYEPLTDENILKQQGFTITPAMAEKVATEGVPLFSTRRWQGVRTRDDYLVPDTPYYEANDQAVDLAEHAGLPVRLSLGNDAAKYGIDHLYKNGVADSYRAADPVEEDIGEGHIRDVLRVLKTATMSYPNTNGKMTLRSPMMGKAVVVQKRKSTRDGEPFWSVITVIPATQSKVTSWGVPERIKAPHLLDPVDSTSTVSYYRDGANRLSKPDRPGLLNSEWFDATRPDRGIAITL